LSLSSVGNALRFTRKQTDAQGKRNFHVRKAEELIKKHAASKNKSVEIDWGKGKKEARTIKVDGNVVFTQNDTDIVGKFAAPYTNIVME